MNTKSSYVFIWCVNETRCVGCVAIFDDNTEMKNLFEDIEKGVLVIKENNLEDFYSHQCQF